MSAAAPYAPRAVTQFAKKRRTWRRPRWLRVTRGGLGYFVMGLIVLCGAVWSFGALVEVGNTATEKAALTTLPAPYAGYLFAGSVDLFIFLGYLKCYGPAWQIVLSVVHILAGLITSVWFQFQHSKGLVDPVLVSVVPPFAVFLSLDSWVISQLVARWNNRTPRPRKLPRARALPREAGSGGPTAAVDTGGADAPSPTTLPASDPVPVPVDTKGLSKADKQALYRAKQKGPAEVERVLTVRNIDRSLVTQNGTKP